MAELSDIVHKVGHELNPANDFERITFKKNEIYDGLNDNDEYIREIIGNTYHNLSQLLWVAKSAVRGAVVGGVAGTIASAIGGGNLYESMALGATLGCIADTNAFAIRLAYRYMKVQFGRYEQ